MATPNLPPGFDFTDPDIYAQRLPTEEFAELRARRRSGGTSSRPIKADSATVATGWSPSTATSARSRCAATSSRRRTKSVVPRYPEELAAGPDRGGPDVDDHDGRPRAQPAAQDRLARFHAARSRAATCRADERAQRIAAEAAATGSGDFVRQVASELPLQAIAGLLGVPQEDRDKLFDWSNQMIGSDDPEFAEYDSLTSAGELMWYAMQLAARKAEEPGDDIVTTLIHADADGHHLSDAEFGMFVVTLGIAGNETTRNSITQGMMAFTDHPDQWELFKAQRPKTAADEIIRWATPITAFQRTAAGGHRTRRRADQEGPAGGDVLPVGQLRRRGLRRPVHLQHPAQPQPARRIRRHRRALLHRRQPGAHDDRLDVQRDRRPPARPDPGGRARAAAVSLHQRHQALAGRLRGSDRQFTSASACDRRSFPDGVFGIIPGSRTTTFRGRASTSTTTSCTTCRSIRRTSAGSSPRPDSTATANVSRDARSPAAPRPHSPAGHPARVWPPARCPGIDVSAGHDDDVLEPAAHHDVVGFREISDVAGVVPPLIVLRRHETGHRGVAVCSPTSPRTWMTPTPRRRQQRCDFVDDADLDARQRSPEAGQPPCLAPGSRYRPV